MNPSEYSRCPGEYSRCPGRPALRVLTPGLLTTVQDLGRPGLGRWGVPRSGALDAESLRLANLAVGNAEDAAGLEMWFDGPTLRAEGPVELCVAGGRFHAEALSFLSLRPGEEIRLRSLDGSPRAVLAVAGGLDVPRVLGSRSTSLAAGFGGLAGRRLEKGDVLALGGDLQRASARRPPGLPPALLGVEGDTVDVRVLRGPQAELFPETSWNELLASRFQVLPASSRVGLRLAPRLGPAGLPCPAASTLAALASTLAAAASTLAALASEGAVLGSIQVPPDGEPIVLLHEGPPTGGYPKLATVIAADLSRLVRTRHDQRLRFREATFQEALDARDATEATIARWR